MVQAVSCPTGGVEYETCDLNLALVGPFGSATGYVNLNGTSAWDCTLLFALVADSSYSIPAKALGGASL